MVSDLKQTNSKKKEEATGPPSALKPYQTEPVRRIITNVMVAYRGDIDAVVKHPPKRDKRKHPTTSATKHPPKKIK
jgi:hypothetical protein